MEELDKNYLMHLTNQVRKLFHLFVTFIYIFVYFIGITY
jgi:hypothetical protein